MGRTPVFIVALIAFLVASAPGFAMKPYISGDIGESYFSNADLKANATGAHAGKFMFNSGGHRLGAVGLGSENFRLEAEIGSQSNDVSDLAKCERGQTGVCR